MKNETEYKRLREKLNTLKDIIEVTNSNILTLVIISARTEIILRNKDISGEEISVFEDKLDCLIEEHLKSNN